LRVTVQPEEIGCQIAEAAGLQSTQEAVREPKGQTVLRQAHRRRQVDHGQVDLALVLVRVARSGGGV